MSFLAMVFVAWCAVDVCDCGSAVRGACSFLMPWTRVTAAVQLIAFWQCDAMGLRVVALQVVIYVYHVIPVLVQLPFVGLVARLFAHSDFSMF